MGHKAQMELREAREPQALMGHKVLKDCKEPQVRRAFKV